ncbi:MAG: hypothetical protein JWM11_3693 [Planctomycetaceae bacterium]|nr:hypothetical protein [Planctomycetaceae bacterium]
MSDLQIHPPPAPQNTCPPYYHTENCPDISRRARSGDTHRRQPQTNAASQPRAHSQIATGVRRTFLSVVLQAENAPLKMERNTHQTTREDGQECPPYVRGGNLRRNTCYQSSAFCSLGSQDDCQPAIQRCEYRPHPPLRDACDSFTFRDLFHGQVLRYAPRIRQQSFPCTSQEIS